jgi:hypothetical protein
MIADLFLRGHVVNRPRRARQPQVGPTWPRHALAFDTETTIDTQQGLIVGVFRLCRLLEGRYQCLQEGLIYPDDAPSVVRRTIDRYARHHQAASEVPAFPPRLDLLVLSRSEFVEQVFWKAVRRGDLIVGFNLPFDLSRLAADWRTSRNGGWALLLSTRVSRKTGQVEPNPYRPRIRVTARNSRSAFISLLRPQRPEEWPSRGRFLDLHTLAAALYDESFSLDGVCRLLKVRGKLKHEPTGRVTPTEIAYCREDVRATVDVLNGLKKEFDQHPVDLLPDLAHSSATIAKAYLDAMGLRPPMEKFKIPARVQAIAMEAYYGGRAECRNRGVELPVVLTDFKSQYPTVNALLGNWPVLTARHLTTRDATNEVRALLKSLTLEQAFRPAVWRELNFFALVSPSADVLPVRSIYNGETRNIGVNNLSSARPLWVAGPDVIADALLTGTIPNIVQAIRIVPRGVQRGLKPIALRGGVVVDPAKEDFFCRVVEEKEGYKHSNASLAQFLKTLANSGSYGTFVEVTPKVLPKPKVITWMEGGRTRRRRAVVTEQHGRWYFPVIGSLITAGGRLLLAMLERCVTDAGGTHLFCDTDSLCIVADRRARLVPCSGGPHHVRGVAAVKALSWSQVRKIVERFASLNPYDRRKVPGSILKIEKINFGRHHRQRQLFGFAISAKRYVLYTRRGRRIRMVAPKAHGLGYLYPPNARPRGKVASWTSEAWDWMLRGELGLPRRSPTWLHRPAMMRITASTPGQLARLRDHTRPFSFLLCPVLDPVIGCPVGVDPQHFTLVAPFSKHADRWWNASCENIHDGQRYWLAPKQRPKLDRAIPQTLAAVLRAYLRHPESKSLGPDGQPCRPETRGLLKRTTVVEDQRHYIGKEADRRWEYGEDLSLLSSRGTTGHSAQEIVTAGANMRAKIRAAGIREMMRRTKFSQHTIERIVRGRPVRARTLQRVIDVLDQRNGQSVPI